MKKIFTLVLLAAGVTSIAAAQSNGPANNRYNHYGTKADGTGYHQQQRYDNNTTVAYRDPFFSLKEKEAAIQQINRAYDRTIAAVKMNRYVSHYEKNKQIRVLENQRAKEIAQVQYRYNNNHHHDVGFEKGSDHKW